MTYVKNIFFLLLFFIILCKTCSCISRSTYGGKSKDKNRLKVKFDSCSGSESHDHTRILTDKRPTCLQRVKYWLQRENVTRSPVGRWKEHLWPRKLFYFSIKQRILNECDEIFMRLFSKLCIKTIKGQKKLYRIN